MSGWRKADHERHGQTIAEALAAASRHPRANTPTLVHGCAPGVDTIAWDIVAPWRWQVLPYPAHWEACGEGCPPRPHLRTRGGVTYCPFAGPRRNEAMCVAGADLLLAFPGPGSRGTWDCLRRAAKYGIPARVYPLTEVDSDG